MDNPDLTAQIACIEREMRLRYKTYPRHVRAGTMTPPQAQHELLTMQAVLQTLRALALQPQQEEMPYGPARA